MAYTTYFIVIRGVVYHYYTHITVDGGCEIHRNPAAVEGFPMICTVGIQSLIKGIDVHKV